MMIRKGTCQNCGATYQVPVDFEHPRAACRICEGAVEIGEPEEPRKKGGKRKGDSVDVGAAAAATAVAAGTAVAAKASGDSKSDSEASTAQEAEASVSTDSAVAAVAVAGLADAGLADAGLEEADLDVADLDGANFLDLSLDDLEEATLDLEPEAPEMPAAAPKPKRSASTLDRLKAQRAAEVSKPAPAEPTKSGGTLARLKAQRAADRPEDSNSSSGGSTLERLKAQRAAQEAPKGSSTLERLKAERTATEPTPPARKSSPAQRGRDEDDERSGGGSRRSGSTRRSGGGSRRGSKERNPLPGILGLGSVVVLVAVMAVGMKQGWFEPDPVEETPEDNTEVAAADGTPAATTATLPSTNSNPFGDVSMTAAAADSTDDVDAEEAGVGDAPSDDEASGDGGNSAPAYNGPDPASIDLSALAAYGPLPETDEETWADIQKQVDRAANPDGGAGSTKAEGKLKDWGKQAMPSIVNKLVSLDVSQKYDADSGMLLSRLLGEILNGRAFNWSEETGLGDQYRNKTIIKTVHEYWGKAETNEDYWSTWAQLDKASDEASD